MRPSFKTFLFIALIAFAATAAQAAKVEICHIPPGNPENWHTISVSSKAVNAHLNHGDLLGSCLENCETLCDDGDACTQDAEPDAQTCVCTSSPVNCDDSNPCTADSCSSEAGACVYDSSLPNGDACDDGDADTENDVCTDGVCAGTPTGPQDCTTLGCAYGGTCVEAVCNCIPGLDPATRCTSFLPPPPCQIVGCQNGGACNPDGSCTCPPGFNPDCNCCDFFP